MSEIFTEQELMEKLELLNLDEEQKKRVACSLIGHSLIQTASFGYYYCARCGEQVGDNFGGIYPNAGKTVIVGHKCPTCEENFNKLTWKDKVLCPDPFADEV
jgi:DNA-directed RNA polymerase subunit RPC12/RpoP